MAQAAVTPASMRCAPDCAGIDWIYLVQPVAATASVRCAASHADDYQDCFCRTLWNQVRSAPHLPAPCPYLPPWRCALFSLFTVLTARCSACLSACVHRTRSPKTQVLSQRASVSCWQSKRRRKGRSARLAPQSKRLAALVGHGKLSCASRRFHGSFGKQTQRYLGRRCFIMCLALTHCCYPPLVVGPRHQGRPSV